jgi:hypothetical protein
MCIQRVHSTQSYTQNTLRFFLLTLYWNVQLHQLGSSSLVSAKFGDLMKNMKAYAFAQEVTLKNKEVRGGTERLLTPKKRFIDDLDVRCARGTRFPAASLTPHMRCPQRTWRKWIVGRNTLHKPMRCSRKKLLHHRSPIGPLNDL